MDIEEAHAEQFDSELKRHGGAIPAALAGLEIEDVPPELHMLWESMLKGVEWLRYLERDIDRWMWAYRQRWERERPVREDPDLAAQIVHGIEEAERGETRDRGSFSEHLDETDGPDLPDWHPRLDLDVVQLANALEHIRRTAYIHWIGDAFDPEHMKWIALVAAQALCAQPIDAPVDLNSPAYKASLEADTDRMMELFDDELERAATVAAPHDHDFEPDPDRTHTLYCTAPRCNVLKSTGLSHHPYRELRHPDGHLVAIDENVSAVIERLWDADVATRGCCQGGCCLDADGTVGPGWILHAVAARDQVAAELDGRSRLRWLEPHDGFQRVEWDAEARCMFWEQELKQRLAGRLMVGVRIEAMHP